MHILPQLTYRNLLPSEAIQAAVRKAIDHIDSQFGSVIRAFEIVIWVPHRHHRKVISYLVRMTIATKTGKTIVTRKSNSDLYLAIKEAMAAAEHIYERHRAKRYHYNGHHNSWGRMHAG